MSLKLPAPYPLAELERANRVAVLAAREGWCAEYTWASYRRWFEEGLAAGSEPNLSESIREAGQDPEAVLPRADAPEAVEDLLSATPEAQRFGIFGAQSFVVGGEIFWGDDRLDDALDWASDPTFPSS